MKIQSILVVAATMLLIVSCSTNSGQNTGRYSTSPNPIQSKTGIVVHH